METLEARGTGKTDPTSLLKLEHQLILKMRTDIERRLLLFRETAEFDPTYVDEATDFMRAYADLCHHGKEEGILFRALAAKDLDEKLRRLMTELIQEHEWARRATQRLGEANEASTQDETGQLERRVQILQQLSHFYRGHITKEESRFFNPCLAYLSEDEQCAMVHDFTEFDGGLDGRDFHERYRQLVDRLGGELAAEPETEPEP